MKAVMYHGSKETPVTVEEVADGGLIVWSENKPLFILRPVEEQSRSTSPQARQEWIFNEGDELPVNIEPQEYSVITTNDLKPGPENSAYNWRLIVRRFPWLFAKDFEYKDAVKFAQEVAQGGETGAVPPVKVSQLELDLEAIRPHLHEIIQYGQFVYGHQSVIARLLGGKNDGGFRRNRVLPVEAALSASLTTSATSTNGASLGRNWAVRPGAAR